VYDEGCGKNVGNYSIILAVTTESEGNLTCTIVQYKKYWTVIGRFDTTLKMIKPNKEQFFIKPPGSVAKIIGSNRTSLSKLRRHLRSGKVEYTLNKINRRHLLHTTVTFFPHSQEIAEPTRSYILARFWTVSALSTLI